jgi:hypothetical protein
MSQAVINWISFLWASLHDVFYLGAYYLFTRMHIIKKHKTVEELIAEHEARIATLEQPKE